MGDGSEPPKLCARIAASCSTPRVSRCSAAVAAPSPAWLSKPNCRTAAVASVAQHLSTCSAQLTSRALRPRHPSRSPLPAIASRSLKSAASSAQAPNRRHCCWHVACWSARHSIRAQVLVNKNRCRASTAVSRENNHHVTVHIRRRCSDRRAAQLDGRGCMGQWANASHRAGYCEGTHTAAGESHTAHCWAVQCCDTPDAAHYASRHRKLPSIQTPPSTHSPSVRPSHGASVAMHVNSRTIRLSTERLATHVL